MNRIDYMQRLKNYPEILNAEQAAEILDVSKKTLYKTIKEKKLHAVKIGREYRIVKSQLIKLLVS